MQECLRCGHKWLPNIDNSTPKQCPKCKSYSYNKPREWRKVKEQPKPDVQPVNETKNDINKKELVFE